MKKVSILLFLISVLSCQQDNVLSEEESSRPILTFTGNVTLESQDDVNDFGAIGYNRIEGFLKIGPFEIPLPANEGIRDLSSLSALTEVTGALNIGFNPNLTSLSGLENITSVERLVIYENEALLNLEGLIGISGSISTLQIVNCDALVDLIGLGNIEHITDYFHLLYNNNIQSMNGLDSLNTLERLRLSANPSLTSIIGLENTMITKEVDISSSPLNSLNGLHMSDQLYAVGLFNCENITSLDVFNNITLLQYLGMSQMDGIISMQGFNNLEEVTYVINISRNANLTSLDGLENLMIAQEFRIGSQYDYGNMGNPSLIDYCAIENFINNREFYETTIGNNAYNPTIVDIINGNCTQ